jgi:TctA family transporter
VPLLLFAARLMNEGGITDRLPAFAMVLAGVLGGLVGTDVISGVSRFIFGRPEVRKGIDIVAIAMGPSGLSGGIAPIRATAGGAIAQTVPLRARVPMRDDVRRSAFPVLRGFGLGR